MESYDSTINKLIILFVFDKMEMPLAEDTVVNVCYYDLVCMQYIECKEALANLLDAGLLCVTGTPGNAMYQLTEDGRACLFHFYTRIPASLRDKIKSYCEQNRLRVRKSQEYFCDYSKNPDGSYNVLLRIQDKNVTIMELKLVVSSRSSAKWIIKNWGDKAAQVYGDLYESLMEN